MQLKRQQGRRLSNDSGAFKSRRALSKGCRVPSKGGGVTEHGVEAVAKPARLLVMLCKYFCVHRPRKQSISKEMNNVNDLEFA